MKKRLILTMAIMSMAFSSVAFAATDNSVSTDKTARENTVFTGSNAPYLIIKPNVSTEKGDAIFKLSLNNAEWQCADEGTIVSGVDYTLLGDNMMMVTVDGDKFNLSSSTLMIPLNVEVIKAGTASVTIDSMNSTVTPGTYTFAHSVYPQSDITVSKFDEETNKFDVKIEDDYGYVFYAKKSFKLTLPKGYEFESYEKAFGEGKYKNIVEFNVDKKYPNVAYISVTGNTNGGNGKMIVEGIQVKTLPTAVPGPVEVGVVAAYGESDALKFKLFEYKDDSKENVVEEKKVVSFTLDKKYYEVGNQKIEMDATVKIDKNGRVIMPARYLANALGINDTNIKWTTDDGGKATITKDGKVIEAKPNEKFLMVNGEKIGMDTSAVIIDDRIYLPLRPIANALGVSDDNISWDDVSKTATIKR